MFGECEVPYLSVEGGGVMSVEASTIIERIRVRTYVRTYALRPPPPPPLSQGVLRIGTIFAFPLFAHVLPYVRKRHARTYARTHAHTRLLRTYGGTCAERGSTKIVPMRSTP